MVNDLSNRRDNSSSTAKTALCKILHFFKVYFSFFHFQTKIFFGNVDQRTAGDGGKNAVGLGRYYFSVFGYEEEVRSAGFFHLCSGSGIQVHIFIKPLFVGIYDGIKAHGIVQAGFDMPGSVRSCPVKVRYTDGQRLCAAFEVGTNRSTEDTELVFICRFYTDNRIAAKHVGTDVQSGAGTVRRYISSIGFHNRNNGVYPFILGEYRHFQSLAGIFHTGCVQIRAEGYNMAVFCSVRFQTFEAGLGILQDAGTLIDHNIGIGGKRTLIPCSIFIIGYKSFVSLDISKSKV